MPAGLRPSSSLPCILPCCFALQADGYPDECIVEGVCKYVDIGQGPVSFEPTTGGKGKSEWEHPSVVGMAWAV